VANKPDRFEIRFLLAVDVETKYILNALSISWEEWIGSIYPESGQ